MYNILYARAHEALTRFDQGLARSLQGMNYRCR